MGAGFDPGEKVDVGVGVGLRDRVEVGMAVGIVCVSSGAGTATDVESADGVALRPHAETMKVATTANAITSATGILNSSYLILDFRDLTIFTKHIAISGTVHSLNRIPSV